MNITTLNTTTLDGNVIIKKGGTPTPPSGGESTIEYLDVSSVDNEVQTMLWDIALEVKMEADDDSLEYVGPIVLMLVTRNNVGFRRTRAISINTKSPIRVNIFGNEITDWNTFLSMLPVDLATLPRLTKEEFYAIKKPKYKIGAFIQHINGNIYSEEEWVSNGFSNDDANGVYGSNGQNAVVIAKDTLGKMPWSSKPITFIDGVTTTTNLGIAENHNTGVDDTAKIAAFDPDSAAAACANYTFPNGQKGYLPSVGELNAIYDFEFNIDELMTLIGGAAFKSSLLWTSLQYSAEDAWYFYFGTHDIHNVPKSTNNVCRPVCTYKNDLNA